MLRRALVALLVGEAAYLVGVGVYFASTTLRGTSFFGDSFPVSSVLEAGWHAFVTTLGTALGAAVSDAAVVLLVVLLVARHRSELRPSA